MKCVLRPESGQPGTLQPSESHPEAIQVDGLSVPLKCARPNDPLMRRLAVSPCTAENATQKHRSRPSPFTSSINLLFLAHSAGVLPCDSSHRLKSFILPLCSTAGCLTRTFNSVNPSPISSTQVSPRKIPSACATASYSDSAVTSTACSVPARSRQETRQERRAMRRRLACFAFCSPSLC